MEPIFPHRLWLDYFCHPLDSRSAADLGVRSLFLLGIKNNQQNNQQNNSQLSVQRKKQARRLNGDSSVGQSSALSEDKPIETADVKSGE